MVDRYLTVAREGVHGSEIKRSRFLCALAPAPSEQAAQDFVRRYAELRVGLDDLVTQRFREGFREQR